MRLCGFARLVYIRADSAALVILQYLSPLVPLAKQGQPVSLVMTLRSKRSRSDLLVPTPPSVPYPQSSSAPLTLADLRRKHRDASPSRSTVKSKKTQPWVWGPGQELAAVISFLTSEHTHALPPLSAEGVVDPGA